MHSAIIQLSSVGPIGPADFITEDTILANISDSLMDSIDYVGETMDDLDKHETINALVKSLKEVAVVDRTERSITVNVQKLRDKLCNWERKALDELSKSVPFSTDIAWYRMRNIDNSSLMFHYEGNVYPSADMAAYLVDNCKKETVKLFYGQMIDYKC